MLTQDIRDRNIVTKEFIPVYTTAKSVRLPVAGRKSVTHTIGIICAEYKVRLMHWDAASGCVAITRTYYSKQHLIGYDS